MTEDGTQRRRIREQRELRRESLVADNPELGLSALYSPADPVASLRVEGGEIVELDSRPRDEFDVLDEFIARHGIDLAVAEEAMGLGETEVARRLVDVNVTREAAVRLARGLTPARLARAVAQLDAVELMFAMKKLRARRRPANQAHVTNRKENPALLAADAAEAARRGFAEVETTVGISRYAPLNAIAILVGSQAGRPGVLTQCSVEERLNLRLGILGLTTYSETLSVYGTERSLVDGDDTPWSKAFLTSAYASRGIKVRFTSGAGAEALMGHAEGKSMLYLEARCLSVVRAAGSQGVQNGSISCVALALSLAGGVREILSENVLAAWLGLEVASGNDAIASHSAIRKTAKLMGQFLPGTDFVTSGYSVMPKADNMFGGGNYDADELDEWMTVQRDWQVDAGIEPVDEGELESTRERAARAIAAVFAGLGFPPVTEAEIEAATRGYDSDDLPDRDRVGDLECADRVLEEGISGADVARVLDRAGFEDVAGAILEMQKLRVSADYLQTAAIVGPDGRVESAVNDGNSYAGPGTGYRLDGDRWELLRGLPYEVKGLTPLERTPGATLVVRGEAVRGSDPVEVVVGLAPAFLDRLRETILELSHEAVLAAIADGVRELGARPRFVRVRRTADVAFVAHDAACLSGSGIGVGLQSKGTAVIHRADLQPLDNLELFSMAPLLTLESYRAIGRNAAAYAVGEQPKPVPTEIDNFARAKLIVKTTLMHAAETAEVLDGASPLELALELAASAEQGDSTEATRSRYREPG